MGSEHSEPGAELPAKKDGAPLGTASRTQGAEHPVGATAREPGGHGERAQRATTGRNPRERWSAPLGFEPQNLRD